jgi:hypothetical protein
MAMQTVTFKPAWKPFDIPASVEGSGVNFPVAYEIEAVLSLESGENSFAISQEDALALTLVTRDNEDVSYTISDGVMTLPMMDRPTIVYMTRSGTPTFSVFAGDLPPGAVLSAGRIRGIMGNIPSKKPVVFRFGLRCQFGAYRADAIRAWTVAPADQSILWNYATLPPAVRSSLATQPYYSFGEVRRGQTIEYDIDIYNPDATYLDVLTRAPSAVVEGANIYSGFPLGITVKSEPFSIQGFIPAEAKAGDYFMELWVDEPLPLPPIIVHFKLLGDSFDTFTAINRIEWQTPKALGLCREGDLSTLSVRAINTTGDPVSYALASGSLSLPVGLLLDAEGNIRGRMPHVEATTQFEITVKASSDRFVASRTFSFSVKKHFDTGKNIWVSLPLSGQVKRDWKQLGTKLTSLYRPSDPNFATATEVNVIRGLKSKPITALPYAKPFNVFVGAYKYATITHEGVPVYDVIYRPLIDPMDKSGGFVANTPDVIPTPVTYPQNASIEIVEASINNVRRDLAFRLGLDSSSSRLLEGELLDAWQTAYEPMLVVGYVMPGTARAQLLTLSYGNMPIGTSVMFDRLLIKDGSNSYYYYMGSGDQNPTQVIVGTPLAPIDMRIDGVDVAHANSRYPEPTFSWVAQEADVIYTIELYSGDTLLRQEETTGTIFRYTKVMQNVDANPGHAKVVVRSMRGDLRSPAVIGYALMHAGWGISWGLRYGGSA